MPGTEPLDTPPSDVPTTTSAPTTSAPTTAAPSTTPNTSSPGSGPLPVPTLILGVVGEFDRPVEIAHRRGDDRIFVVEQTGRVMAVGATSTTPVIDLGDRLATGQEQGLLGLAFDPEEDLAYLHFNDTDGRTILAEYAIDADSAMFDPTTERVVLSVDQPFPNHNGGELLFGPDGLLYLGLGDGGSADDPFRNALDLGSPLGKILRIEPHETSEGPFTIPDDNPFLGIDGADQRIWAYGLRNPWKFSFDSDTGDLWIADVGQARVEEVNRAPANDGLNAGRGLNFGWSAFEGLDRFNEDQVADDATPPVLTYSHEGGNCSVSGGAVARTDDDLAGWYVFGDFCSGIVWGYDTTSPANDPILVELAQVSALAAIAEGPDGNLYAVSNSGTVFRLDTL